VIKLRTSVVIAALVVTAGLSACSSSSNSSTAGAAASSAPASLRLGYYPNITHAAAIVGVNDGIFARDLGPNVHLTTSTFNAGPAAMQALLTGAIDATYVGPSPTITAWTQSHGSALKIIAGATSGGASLVVKPSINSAADLKGKKIASPQLGNTQDVSLRAWLKSNGLSANAQGGGDVSVLPQDNATTLQAFESGLIDGAWVPEPWAARLVQDGHGKVLVDERSLWPQGQFVTTQLVVATSYLNKHPSVVAALLKGNIDATNFINANPAEAQTIVNDGIKKLTGKSLSSKVVQDSWSKMTFTVDPIAASLYKQASAAESVGLLKSVNLKGIYDLAPLNTILKAQGKPQVNANVSSSS
jgi:NitT/TauT family transport system substrate-binding protein